VAARSLDGEAEEVRIDELGGVGGAQNPQQAAGPRERRQLTR
jgi:hypothetical protein